MAKRRFGKARKARKAGRKSVKRMTAGRKAWRTKCRRYGKAACIAMLRGKRRKGVKKVRKARKGYRGYSKARRAAAARKGWRNRRK
jgi:hypothetical protein